MISKYIKKDKYNLYVAYLFFFFLTAPILSPYIKGFTVYIYWFIPLLDYSFILYLIEKIKQNIKPLIITIIVCILTSKLVLLFKILSIIFTLIYLIYTKKNNYFVALYKCVILNIIVAIIQFIFIYIDPGLAYKIGPTNIAKVVWGNLATETFTNFYTIFLIPRVSGLAREAGFLASLVCTTFMIYLLDNNIVKKPKYIIMFFIGIVLSFSKISLIYIGLIVIFMLRKLINNIPLIIGSLLFVVFMIFISNNILINKYSDLRYESITHRISGYTVMNKMKFNDLVFGIDSMKQIEVDDDISFLNNLSKNFDEFTGIPNIIINEGLIITIFFILLLKYYKISFSGFLLLTLISFTTTYFTSAAHIQLAYFIIFYYKNLLNEKSYIKIF